MKFYDDIRGHYDAIFPLTEEKVTFVKALAKAQEAKSLLDVGCATGKFCHRMTPWFDRVDGFDLDAAMVALAAERYTGHGLNFRVGDMTVTETVFDHGPYDVVTCFGNTLVHLDREGLDKALGSIRRCLGEDGVFLGQIINYDYVATENLQGLPLIDNEVVRFDRHYRWQEAARLDFTGKLTVKATGAVSENTISLWPIKRQALTEALEKAGFNTLTFYKNYLGEKADGGHLPLIFTARP